MSIQPHSEVQQLTFTEQQAAKYLNVAVRTLQKWRCRGGGPFFIKTSARHVRYRQADLNAWQEEHLVRSTSEYYVKNPRRG